MVDPLSALAMIKTGISAGKTLVSMSKDISSFFDSVDNAKKEHQKKKDSIFSSSNEEALDTWMKKQQAIEAEAALREIIISQRGYSAYQDLLKIRREIAQERKERERKERKEAEELREQLELAAVGVVIFIIMVVLTVAALHYKGYL